MSDKRSLILMISVVAVFCVAVTAIFLNGRVPQGSYEVITERNTVIVSDPPSASELVDINTASLEELCTLPGIGESLAGAIIDYREEFGPFEVPADIMQVKGIGEGIYDRISDYITTETYGGGS